MRRKRHRPIFVRKCDFCGTELQLNEPNSDSYVVTVEHKYFCKIHHVGEEPIKDCLEDYIRSKNVRNEKKKIDEKFPNEVILVLDATSGQNILSQVDEFNKIIPITGLVMTKLDGTAKGGILLALAKKYKIPIIGLGLGEKEDDLQIFDVEKFAEAFTQIN